MKYVFMILFAALCAECYAQNWSMFPPGRRLFYQPEGTMNLIELRQDSVYWNGTDSVFLFNAKAPVTDWQTCYNAMWSPDNWYGNQRMYFTGSHTDMQLYQDPLTTDPLYFSLSATVGSSWSIAVTDPFSPWDEVVFTLDSVGQMEIYGEQDSVRYYSLSVEPAATGAAAIDDVRIRLSKHHGLLTLYNWADIVQGVNCINCFTETTQVGYIQEADTAGVVIPDWSAYFQLQPGDVLEFSTYGYMGLGAFTRVITGVERSADSVVLHYTDDGVPERQVFYREVIEAMLEGADRQMHYGNGFANQSTLSTASDETMLYTAYAISIVIDDTLLSGQTLIRKVFSGEDQIDTVLCNVQLAELESIGYTFTTWLGLTSSYYCYPPYGCTGYYLADVILHSETDTSDDAAGNTAHIIVWPNPATQIIVLPAAEGGQDSYSIYNTAGQLVQQGETDAGTIDIGGIRNGLYIIQLEHEGNLLRGKFVKTGG